MAEFVGALGKCCRKSALGIIGVYGGGVLRKPRRIVRVCRGFFFFFFKKNGKMRETFFYPLSFILAVN